MLTTIGDKIIEIRPKQIIETNQEIKNHYLRLVREKKKTPTAKGIPKIVKDAEQHTEQPSEHTEADT